MVKQPLRLPGPNRDITETVNGKGLVEGIYLPICLNFTGVHRGVVQPCYRLMYHQVFSPSCSNGTRWVNCFQRLCPGFALCAGDCSGPQPSLGQQQESFRVSQHPCLSPEAEDTVIPGVTGPSGAEPCQRMYSRCGAKSWEWGRRWVSRHPERSPAASLRCHRDPEAMVVGGLVPLAAFPAEVGAQLSPCRCFPPLLFS